MQPDEERESRNTAEVRKNGPSWLSKMRNLNLFTRKVISAKFMKFTLKVSNQGEMERCLKRGNECGL